MNEKRMIMSNDFKHMITILSIVWGPNELKIIWFHCHFDTSQNMND